MTTPVTTPVRTTRSSAVRALVVAVSVAVVVGIPSAVLAHEGHGDHTHDGAAAVVRNVWHPVTFAGWVLTGIVLATIGAAVGYMVVNLRRRATITRHR